MRRELVWLPVCLWLAAVGGAWSAPMGHTLQQQLLGIYSHYNQEIAAGQLDDALALRSGDVRTELNQQLKTAKDRQDYLAGAAGMIPDRLAVQHASVNEAAGRALVVALADKTLPSGRVENEIDLAFVQEGGVWKLGPLTVGPGPADIRHCPNTTYDPISTYDTSKPVSLAGRIRQVDVASDHILLRVLSGNVETCVFLPNESVLRQHGLDPNIFQPFRTVEISGVAQRSDPQKVMVNNITVRAEE
jgi:hypothetical protein